MSLKLTSVIRLVAVLLALAMSSSLTITSAQEEQQDVPAEVPDAGTAEATDDEVTDEQPDTESEEEAATDPSDEAEVNPAEAAPSDQENRAVVDEPDGQLEQSTPRATDAPGAEEDAQDGAQRAGEASADQASQAGATGGGLPPWAIGLLLVAVFVLPVVIGHWIAKQVGMPDHGWRISVMLGSLAISAVILSLDEFKFGPDLAGGLTLIYELADTSVTELEDGQSEDEDEPGAGRGRGPNRELVRRLTDALKQRVDPTGTREVTIRPYGSAIEIIIPHTGQEDRELIKRRITSLGQLEFRITADPRWGERDRNIIERARLLPPAQKTVELNGEVVAEWVAFSQKEFGGPDEQRIVTRMAGDRPEALVLRDPYNVTGQYLDRVSKGFDQRGGPAVDFVFNAAGSKRFGSLTGKNRPNPATGSERYLGIVLDNVLLSAPGIRERITGQGQISGGAMTEEEVEFIISVLDAGSLPAALNPEPLSEEVISSTLGVETIRKGSIAIAVSLGVVLVFMLVYYRFAGFVACGALLTNLLLVLAVMLLIDAAFTLPGLAGLVLTVGMSVDANVLIFERIREELNRGSALRMAIRNGFGRATTTIVDANLTTLITGVVLYAIGTDQIKGFAVTLILGILVSMYTAIFCARVIFDVAERRRWITTLKMNHIIGLTNFDFIRKRYVAGFFSAILIVLGLAAVVQRGSGILDIDFTGGTSVTMVLEDDQPMTVGSVRGELEQTPLIDRNLLIVERGESGTRFTINSSTESVSEVQAILTETFADRAKTYDVNLVNVESVSNGNFEGSDATFEINLGQGYEEEGGVSHDAFLARVTRALEAAGYEGLEPTLTAPGYQTGSAAQFKEWTVRLDLDADSTRTVLQGLANEMSSQPMFPLSNKIGGKVAGNLQMQAAYAILVSLLGIIGYLWLRFQKVTFGLSAVAALVHDVLITLGMLAISAAIVNYVPAVADALLIDSFQISLPIIAAFLTIIGYSLNDTIVIFDRIREVRGKSPQITADMINTSINQTLSRTLLTSFTTLIVVAILYAAGGAGIHSFAFALVVGVIAGTYSTVFIASPILLAMSGSSGAATPSSESPANR